MPFTKDELERIADQANRWSIEKYGVPYLEHADRVAAFLGVPRQPCAECFDMADYSFDLEGAVAVAKRRFPTHGDPAQYDGDIARFMQSRGWEPDGRFWRTSAQDGRRTRPTTTDTAPPEPRGD